MSLRGHDHIDGRPYTPRYNYDFSRLHVDDETYHRNDLSFHCRLGPWGGHLLTRGRVWCNKSNQYRYDSRCRASCPWNGVTTVRECVQSIGFVFFFFRLGPWIVIRCVDSRPLRLSTMLLQSSERCRDFMYYHDLVRWPSFCVTCVWFRNQHCSVILSLQLPTCSAIRVYWNSDGSLWCCNALTTDVEFEIAHSLDFNVVIRMN
jgi:hypothetical protein